jgi:hypothetical protein
MPKKAKKGKKRGPKKCGWSSRKIQPSRFNAC